MSAASALLEVEDLHVSYLQKDATVQAVRGVSFAVGRGERVGIAGESGSGKTASALAIAGLLPASARVEGSIRLAGRELTTLPRRRRRVLAGSEIGMIFQNPLNSLNPAMTIGDQIAEPLRLRLGLARSAARRRAIELMGEVGIPRPERSCDEYPYRFSGGMRQRAMIAIALASRPRLIIADEPTTALDVTIQAQILELLSDLCRDHDATLVMITHDLGVLAGIADRILVMYSGRIVEAGSVDEVYYRPAHPYTWAMLGSLSRLDRPRERLQPIQGEPPSAVTPPGGCPFHPRCAYAVAICRDVSPVARAVGDGDHAAACHLAGQVSRPAAALGREPTRAAISASAPLLEVRDLSKVFPIIRGASFRHSIGTLTAVDGVSLTVASGETLGLVGESGCGKSTLARCVLRLAEPTSGQVIFAGQDVRAAGKHQLRALRRQMQIIFQDPYASLNPRMTVEALVSEPLLVHGLVTGRREARARAAELLGLVGLGPEHAARYPQSCSGGQRQRVAIARALATEPRLLILDEPVSALDVSTRAQILELLGGLQERLGLAYLFVAHDLSLVRYISHRVAVMYLGKIIETAPRDELFDRPQHPYTQALLSAVPVPDPRLERRRRRIALPGEAATGGGGGGEGCRFRPRCSRAASACINREPPLEASERPSHATACFFPAARSPTTDRPKQEVS